MLLITRQQAASCLGAAIQHFFSAVNPVPLHRYSLSFPKLSWQGLLWRFFFPCDKALSSQPTYPLLLLLLTLVLLNTHTHTHTHTHAHTRTQTNTHMHTNIHKQVFTWVLTASGPGHVCMGSRSIRLCPTPISYRYGHISDIHNIKNAKSARCEICARVGSQF